MRDLAILRSLPLGKLCLGVFFIAGCGPGKLLPRPTDLPERLGERRLWHTPSAYIYAKDEAVAGEARRWVEEVAADVRKKYQVELGKGLVIVVDKGEPPCVTPYARLYELQRATAPAGGADPAEQPTLAEQEANLADSGMTEKAACSVTPVALDDAALAAAGLGGKLPADVAWRICCPSERLMEAALWEFAPQKLEKEKGKAFALLTAWAWPLAFGEAAKTFRVARDALTFELWANRQTDWSADKRTAAVASYLKARAAVISPTVARSLAAAESQKPGKTPATQPAGETAQPATTPAAP